MSLILPCTKYIGICVVVASSYGIQKMDEYMESLDATLDEVSERLITLGGARTLAWLSSWNIATSKKKKGSFERSMEENLGRVLSIFRYLVSLYQKKALISQMLKEMT